MAITVTDINNITVAGDTLGQGGGPYTTITQPTNNNAPPPDFRQLAIGVNTILVPAGYQVACCTCQTPGNSTNSKTAMGAIGDTGFPSWTSASPKFPVVAGGNFVIVSSQVETLKLIWS
jgi:hypothetical protein